MDVVLIVIGILAAWCLLSVIVALLMGRALALQRPPRVARPATAASRADPGRAMNAAPVQVRRHASQRGRDVLSEAPRFNTFRTRRTALSSFELGDRAG